MAKPSLYTDEIAEDIIRRLWDGEALTAICRDEGMPAPRTVRDWTAAHPEFGEAYKAAMEGGAYALIEETTEIVDNLEERPESRKVRAWQRFELAKRKAPHAFGDKVALQHSGAVGNVEMTHEQWLASLK